MLMEFWEGNCGIKLYKNTERVIFFDEYYIAKAVAEAKEKWERVGDNIYHRITEINGVKIIEEVHYISGNEAIYRPLIVFREGNVAFKVKVNVVDAKIKAEEFQFYHEALKEAEKEVK